VRRIFARRKGVGEVLQEMGLSDWEGLCFFFVPHLLEVEGESNASNDDDGEVRFFCFLTTARPVPFFGWALLRSHCLFVMTVHDSPTTLVYPLAGSAIEGVFMNGKRTCILLFFGVNSFNTDKHDKRWYNRTHTGWCDLTSLPLRTISFLVKDYPIILYFPLFTSTRKETLARRVGLRRRDKRNEDENTV
jgi:hypothetical protein